MYNSWSTWTLGRPERCCQSRSSHSAARACFSGSRKSRACSRTLASTKQRTVMELLPPGIGLRRAFERERPPGAPGAMRRLVRVFVPQLALEQHVDQARQGEVALGRAHARLGERLLDRKITRLNSSHMSISYAVFCLKKKKK